MNRKQKCVPEPAARRTVCPVELQLKGDPRLRNALIEEIGKLFRGGPTETAKFMIWHAGEDRRIPGLVEALREFNARSVVGRSVH